MLYARDPNEMRILSVFMWLRTFEQSLYAVLSRILKEGLSGGIIQTQELPLIIRTVCNGFAGHLFAWDFVQENWDRLIKK